MGPGSMGPPPSPQEMAQLEEFLRSVDPQRLQELQQIKERDPRMWQRQIAESVERMRFLERLKKMDPAGYQAFMQEVRLEARSRGLARSWHEADAGRKAALKARLAQRQKNRESIVDRHMADMLRDPGTEW